MQLEKTTKHCKHLYKKSKLVYTIIYLRFLPSTLSVVSSPSMLKYVLKIYKVVFSKTWRLAVKHKQVLLPAKVNYKKCLFYNIFVLDKLNCIFLSWTTTFLYRDM